MSLNALLVGKKWQCFRRKHYIFEERQRKVQGKQGSVRRIKEAAEAELDPKRMLRTHRRLLVISPH